MRKAKLARRLAAVLLLAGCQSPGPIPPPPIPARPTTTSETPATRRAAIPTGPTDPQTLARAIESRLTELPPPTQHELPIISDPTTQPAPAPVVVAPPTPAPTPVVITPPPPAPVAPTPVAPPAPVALAESPANRPMAVNAIPSAAILTPSSTTDLETRVERRAAADPRDFSAQLDASLLAVLRSGDTNIAPPAPSPVLAAEDREILSALSDSLVNLRGAARLNANALYAAKVRPLADLADRLRSKGDLQVPVVSLASRIDSFGVYQPAEPLLQSHRETVTLVYAEVANFASRPNDAHIWETSLTQQITLYNAAGAIAWQDQPQKVHDQCRNRRNDFFVPRLVRIPPQPPGKYTLKVSILDSLAGRLAEGVLPLTADNPPLAPPAP